MQIRELAAVYTNNYKRGSPRCIHEALLEIQERWKMELETSGNATDHGGR